MNTRFNIIAGQVCQILHIDVPEGPKADKDIVEIFNKAIEAIKTTQDKNLLARTGTVLKAAHYSQEDPADISEKVSRLKQAVESRAQDLEKQKQLFDILDKLIKDPTLFDSKYDKSGEEIKKGKTPFESSNGWTLENGIDWWRQNYFFSKCVENLSGSKDPASLGKLPKLIDVILESLIRNPSSHASIDKRNLVDEIFKISPMNEPIPLKVVVADERGQAREVPLTAKNLLFSHVLKTRLPEAEGEEVEVTVQLPISFEALNNYLQYVENKLPKPIQMKAAIQVMNTAGFLTDIFHRDKMLLECERSIQSLGLEGCIEALCDLASEGLRECDIEPSLMKQFCELVLLETSFNETLEAFQTLSEQLGKNARYVKTLYLDFCWFDGSSFEKIAKAFPGIEKLNIEHVESIQTFPAGVWLSLEEVNAHGSSLKDISSLANLANLKHLDLSGAPIEVIPEGSWPKLVHADFHHCKFLSNVTALKGKGIEYLNVSDTPYRKSVEFKPWDRDWVKQEWPNLKTLECKATPGIDGADWP